VSNGGRDWGHWPAKGHPKILRDIGRVEWTESGTCTAVISTPKLGTGKKRSSQTRRTTMGVQKNGQVEDGTHNCHTEIVQKNSGTADRFGVIARVNSRQGEGEGGLRGLDRREDPVYRPSGHSGRGGLESR